MASSQTPSSGAQSILLKWLPRLAPIAAGGLAGSGLFVWIHQFLATFGVSLPVTAGLTMVLAFGIALAWARQSRAVTTSRYARAIAWLIIAVWTVSFPGFLTLSRGLMQWLPCTWLETDATSFTLLLSIAAALFLLPVAAVSVLGLRTSDGGTPLLPCSLRFLLGFCLALGTSPVLWASWATVGQIGLVVTGLAAAAFWIRLVGDARTLPRELRAQIESPTAVTGDWRHSLWVLMTSLLIGLLLPVVQRMMMQFLPGNSFLHHAYWAGTLFGIACGAVWSSWLQRRPHATLGHDNLITASLIAAVWPVLLLLICPLLLQWNLSANVRLSSVVLLTLIRWILMFAAGAPLGAALGRTWSHRESKQSLDLQSSIGAGGVICLAAGCVLMQALWIAPRVSLMLLVFAAIILLTGRLWTLDRIVLLRRHWAGGAIAVAMVASLPAAMHNYRPDLAARLLFSTQTFMAHRSGVDRELLPHLDDGRLVALRDGRQSTWTVWSHRGSQLLLRQNGIPVGMVSTEPSVCPQFAGDIMPAVVPLVVHPQPNRVLLVGLGSTATLSTCLACPVQEVTCLEGDHELIRINDEIISAASGVNPLEDDRVRLRTVDPTLSLLASGDEYDVVIVGDSQPYLLNQTSRFTREFYATVKQRLDPGGVLCQRLQYADFGRRPIETMLATLRSVFPQVICLESAPGEMLLLASHNRESLFDETLLKRCEAAHVRRLLAQLGWDWSVLLNLAAISAEQVDEINASGIAVNTVSNGLFAYRLPQEVMRCDPKWREVQRLMGERGSRMLAWLGEEADTQDVSKRLADMNEQQRLIVEYPDRSWMYRATLKERLKERPRDKIMPVNHELQRTLHPEDQRRKEYLETLGEAATQEVPDPADIARMTEFAEPYDPLVSYFLHQEAARLYQKTPAAHREAEFNHLRYSVHFGPQQDRSVRNVVAALQLLIDEPQLIPDPQSRWDEMNALLDVLRQRSALRVETDRTASSFELVDAEQSIKVAERAMKVMDDLHADAQVAAADWEHRRTVLRRFLIRPMWTYHSKQSERLAALEARKLQTAAVEEEETRTK